MEVTQDLIDESEEERFEEMPETSHLIDLPTCELNKLEEIADCFIVLMNIAMFSGFDGNQLTDAIINKLNEVSERIGA